MNPKHRPWVQKQIHHFRSANLRNWQVHPAISTGEMRMWMADVPPDTPHLSLRSAYALCRLYRLEAYSAENAVLLSASVRTAKMHGWGTVCDIVGVPTNTGQWPAYRFPGQDAVASYFENAFDALTSPFIDTDELNEQCAAVYAQQYQAHETFDLERVLSVSGVTISVPAQS